MKKPVYCSMGNRIIKCKKLSPHRPGRKGMLRAVGSLAPASSGNFSSKPHCVFFTTNTQCHVHVNGYTMYMFSRLGIQVSLAIICLFVWAMVGWVTLPFLFL